MIRTSLKTSSHRRSSLAPTPLRIINPSFLFDPGASIETEDHPSIQLLPIRTMDIVRGSVKDG